MSKMLVLCGTTIILVRELIVSALAHPSSVQYVGYALLLIGAISHLAAWSYNMQLAHGSGSSNGQDRKSRALN